MQRHYACWPAPSRRSAPRATQTQAPPTLLVRAGLAALDFEPALAVELAERALLLMPGNVSARSLLAATKLGTGDAGGALLLCQALRAEVPGDQYLIALETTAWRLLGDKRHEQLCNYLGELILFPSYFWHGTTPFRSAQARLSGVAFDAVPLLRQRR